MRLPAAFAFALAAIISHAVAFVPVHTVSAAPVGFRQLTSIHPCAVTRGTESEVKLRSNFTLDGAYAVYFDEPGITMTLAETKPIAAALERRGSSGTPFRFKVKVPADQTPRIYEVRVATPEAVSSVTSLLVSDYPVAVETEKENGDAAKAQTVAVPSAVCGVCDPAEDVDCFRFAGKRGQIISMQVYAQRITAPIHDMVGPSQTYHMDPILTLYSPSGQIVGMNDNAFGGDSLLTVDLPHDGEYVMAVRDTRYLGNPRYSYCVEIAEGTPAVAVFPPVVSAGKATDVDVLTVGGRKIGAAKLAAGKTEGLERKRFALGNGQNKAAETNPVEYAVSTLPQLLHDRPTTLDKPRDLALPVGVSGRLAKPGDAHCFAFTAEKDAWYTVAVDSRRYRMPVDAFFEVYAPDGKKLTEADDGPMSSDAKLTFQTKAPGKYKLLVRDLHGRGGPEFVYHLRAERAEPDFEFSGKYYYAFMAPGTRAIWFAAITRTNGFDGPIELKVEGLPAGVTQTPITVPPGMNHGGIILSAAPDAKIGASLVKITGRAKIRDSAGKEREIVREGVINCELQNGGGGQGAWPVRTSIVGVVKSLDLSKVEASPAEITLAPGEKADLTVKIERNPSYDGPVTIDFTWGYFTSKLGEQLPPGVTVGKGSTARLSGKTLEGKITLEAASGALPVERLPIAVMAGVSISFSIDTKYASNPVYLTVKPDTKKSVPVAKK
jgi:hypothetical protein